MKNKFLKVGVLVLSLSSIGVGSVYIWKIKKSVDGLKSSLPEVYVVSKLESKAEHVEKKSEEHGESAKKESEHGGGHGEAPKAESGGHGGGHGETAKAEGEHGGGHGEAAGRTPASATVKGGVPLFSVDELIVNVNSEKGAHMMALKLELELFEDESRNVIKSRHSGVRDRIIEISRGFDYAKLSTLGGKLYFKETIVGTLNEFFGQAIIKNAHISSLYIQ